MQFGRSLIFVILCLALTLNTISAYVKRSDRTVRMNLCPLSDVKLKPKTALKLRCACVTPPDCRLGCREWTYACLQQYTGERNVIQHLVPGNVSITVLDLSMNKITTIKNQAFSDEHFSGLTVLRLANNILRALRKGVFAPIEKLLYLDFSNNALGTVQANIFSRLKSLSTLRLDRNAITKLSSDCFNKLGNLEELYLDHNQLRGLGGKDRFDKLINLKELHLSHNQLTKTFTALYESSTKLEYLDLSYNKIKFISARAFVAFPNLKWLHMEGNPLTTKTGDAAFINTNLIFWFSVESDDTIRWIEVVNGTGVIEEPDEPQTTSIASGNSTDITSPIVTEHPGSPVTETTENTSNTTKEFETTNSKSTIDAGEDPTQLDGLNG